MTYNSTQVFEKIIDNAGRAKKAQVGVDLTVEKIEEIKPTVENNGLNSTVYMDENSKLQGIRYIDAPHYGDVYYLSPNTAYAITFEQGLKKLEDNEWAEIINRSSLNRAGIRVQGSVYDPGFYCNKLGATLYTSQCGIQIPKGTRIAQILIHESIPTDNEYNGRWQGKANE